MNLFIFYNTHPHVSHIWKISFSILVLDWFRTFFVNSLQKGFYFPSKRPRNFKSAIKCFCRVQLLFPNATSAKHNKNETICTVAQGNMLCICKHKAVKICKHLTLTCNFTVNSLFLFFMSKIMNYNCSLKWND